MIKTRGKTYGDAPQIDRMNYLLSTTKSGLTIHIEKMGTSAVLNLKSILGSRGIVFKRTPLHGSYKMDELQPELRGLEKSLVALSQMGYPNNLDITGANKLFELKEFLINYCYMNRRTAVPSLYSPLLSGVAPYQTIDFGFDVPLSDFLFDPLAYSTMDGDVGMQALDRLSLIVGP